MAAGVRSGRTLSVARPGRSGGGKLDRGSSSTVSPVDDGAVAVGRTRTVVVAGVSTRRGQTGRVESSRVHSWTRLPQCPRSGRRNTHWARHGMPIRQHPSCRAHGDAVRSGLDHSQTCRSVLSFGAAVSVRVTARACDPFDYASDADEGSADRVAASSPVFGERPLRHPRGAKNGSSALAER